MMSNRTIDEIYWSLQKLTFKDFYHFIMSRRENRQYICTSDGCVTRSFLVDLVPQLRTEEVYLTVGIGRVVVSVFGGYGQTLYMTNAALKYLNIFLGFVEGHYDTLQLKLYVSSWPEIPELLDKYLFDNRFTEYP